MTSSMSSIDAGGRGETPVERNEPAGSAFERSSRRIRGSPSFSDRRQKRFAVLHRLQFAVEVRSPIGSSAVSPTEDACNRHRPLDVRPKLSSNENRPSAAIRPARPFHTAFLPPSKGGAALPQALNRGRKPLSGGARSSTAVRRRRSRATLLFPP